MVKLTDKQRRDLIELMENPGLENATAEQMADLVWEWCSNAWNDRAKFAVVGQQTRDLSGMPVPRGTGEKLVLGLYSTEGMAHAAAMSLVSTPSSNEQYATWALPIVHSTAALHFRERARQFREEYADQATREQIIAACRGHVLADIAAHPDDERYAEWRWQQFYDMFPEAKP